MIKIKYKFLYLFFFIYYNKKIYNNKKIINNNILYIFFIFNNILFVYLYQIKFKCLFHQKMIVPTSQIYFL